MCICIYSTTFNPIKTSHKNYYNATIPNKLTHSKQNIYNFFSLRFYLLYKLLAAIETEIKLMRRVFYGQKVSISKFKFLLSSLVLHCNLLTTSPLSLTLSFFHTHTHTRLCYYVNAIIFYTILLFLVSV